ncbi:MAG: adenine deaminase [Alistipes sp.]|nr:adenine deaminase [Alistipes sp.]
MHIESSMVLPVAFGEAVLPFGTTAVIADPHEIVNVAGKEGVRFFLDNAAQAPIDVYLSIPSSVPATPLDTNGAGEFLAEDMVDFVNHPQVVGLGEVMNPIAMENKDPQLMAKIALFAEKTIDGHLSGLSPERVEACRAVGLANDHECINEEELLARYKAGLNIYIREGSAARNAKALLAAAHRHNIPLHRLAFCTDDKHLSTIAQEGHISTIVRMAHEQGFTWGEIAAMASYNPCRYYHLQEKGLIRAGYIADIAVMSPDADSVKFVFKAGKLVAKDSKPLYSCKKNNSEAFAKTVQYRTFRPEDFVVPTHLEEVAIRLLPGEVVTAVATAEEFGKEKMNLLATIERYGKNGNYAVSKCIGYGLTNGAIATSVSHDGHNVVCAGDNAADMALACNFLQQQGGGYVIASKGKIVGYFALPAYGLMSALNADEAMRGIQKLEELAHQMGVGRDMDPFITLSFVALPVIPDIRLLDTGLYNVVERRFY